MATECSFSVLALAKFDHAAVIDEVAQGAKTESDELVVKRVELAHRRNMQQMTTEQGDVALERALRGNGFK